MSPANRGALEGAEPTKATATNPVAVYSKWCKGCGICIEFCPTKALTMSKDGRPRVLDADKCNGCGMCEIRCPDFAITVKRRPRG